MDEAGAPLRTKAVDAKTWLSINRKATKQAIQVKWVMRQIQIGEKVQRHGRSPKGVTDGIRIKPRKELIPDDVAPKGRQVV